jgi:hypothetical protein
MQDIKLVKENNMEEEIKEAAERYVEEDNCNRYYNDFITGAKWMLEKLQDFDTWKEWKDINFKSE